ncbi:MAG: hypothetical protein HYX20_02190 [Candidatus Yanofskybacteria bacterium]|nr:hypothetical protein [Candidatus Yanofskybacteria bacterium]
MSEFKKNILATLTYYDVFDFPLKMEEVFNYLINFQHLGISLLSTVYCPLSTVSRELDQLILEGVIGLREGYYFLFDREYLVPLRIKREKIAQRKWQITKRAVWWLHLVPYVKVVFASGSLAMRNMDELSDLDVLVIIKHGRIWLTRFFITGLLSLLRVRRRGNDKIAPNKICLNHYITDKSLSIPHKSIYNAQTYANLVPIFVSDSELIDDFKKANGWVLDYVCEWDIENKEVELRLRSSTSQFLVKLTEWLLDNFGIARVLEKWFGHYQSRRIAHNPVSHQTGGRVIFTDEQLEFHPHSIEMRIIKDYNERMLKLNLPQLAIEKDSGLTTQ